MRVCKLFLCLLACSSLLLVAGCTDEPGDDDVSPQVSAPPDDETPTPESPTPTAAPETSSPDTATPVSETPSGTPVTDTPATDTPTGTGTPTSTPLDTTAPAVDQDGDAYTVEDGDCDDTDSSVHPGADETPYDSIDQDCSGGDLVDVDGDGSSGAPGPDSAPPEDCDDADPSTYPGALEIPYDDLDSDCDGQDPDDADGDGYDGIPAGGNDCDDQDVNTYPGAIEFADGKDNDCDGTADNNLDTWDDDGDGQTEAGDGTNPGDCDDTDATTYSGAIEVPYDDIDQDCDGADLADVDGDGVDAEEAGGFDCDDVDPSINPGAEEVCDSVDNDCDDVVDADATDRQTYYADVDGDGFGDQAAPVLACALSAGIVSDATDCDDRDASINPSASEACDGADNDCDGATDEGLLTTFYADSDGDGYGNPAKPVQACTQPAGYVADGTDCKDSNDQVHPGAAEQCNGADDDCDGSIDEGVRTTWYADADGDGYGNPSSTTQSCTQPPGYVAAGNDCNDADASIKPGAVETCNSVDDDCDGQTDEGLKSTWYADADEDGYGNPSSSTQACAQPAGYVSNSGDCNDASAAINPDAAELCNGIDDNCNKVIDEDVKHVYYRDSDGDGFGATATTTQACSRPTGYSELNGDCNDADASIYPGALEACNGKDDNCNGSTDEGVKSTFYQDSDGDGFGVSSSTVQACTAPSGYAAKSGDCNDASASIYPGATETANGVDDDCDGSTDEGVYQTSCKAILAAQPSATSGTYTIDIDGSGSVAPFAVYCDMSTNGGGWTLAFLKNSAHNGAYPTFGAGNVAVAQLVNRPEDASVSSAGYAAWLDLNTFSYTTLRLASYQNGSRTYLSSDIYKTDLRIRFGEYGYLLYGDRNGYYWCGGAASYTDGGSGQVNQPSGAPSDCKGHGSLGSGWDFSHTDGANAGLTMCGADAGSRWMSGTYGGGAQYTYPSVGAAYAIWAR